MNENAVKIAVTRAWNDLAPKLVAFLTGGAATTAALSIAATYFDVTLDPAVTGAIVVAVGTILGYFVKDTRTVDAKHRL